MKNKITPLPSYYKHTKFRSRLEARWAAYFDMIGCKWEYEPEGYSLPSGNYCPDFLCGDGFFVEVKPLRCEVEEIAKKLIELAKLTGLDVIGVYGPPSLTAYPVFTDDDEANEEGAIMPAVFCHYAFTVKQWGVPFYIEDGSLFSNEPYSAVARGMRFENGVAAS